LYSFLGKSTESLLQYHSDTISGSEVAEELDILTIKQKAGEMKIFTPQNLHQYNQRLKIFIAVINTQK
jgi:hypothetical protein